MNAVDTVKTLVVALQSGDMELAAQTLSDDFTSSGFTPKPVNKGVFLGMQSELLTAMPDFSYNLAEARQEGDGVQAFISITGTHTNDLVLPMFGVRAIPATGIAVTLPQSHVTYQVDNNRVTAMRLEVLSGGGIAGLLQQVGAEIPLLSRERDLSE